MNLANRRYCNNTFTSIFIKQIKLFMKNPRKYPDLHQIAKRIFNNKQR